MRLVVALAFAAATASAQSCFDQDPYWNNYQLDTEMSGATFFDHWDFSTTDYNVGAADYLALARAVRTLYLTDVPVLSRTRRNEARRFVVLVDALYEARVRLVVAAAAPRDAIVAPLLDGAAGGEPMSATEICSSFSRSLPEDADEVVAMLSCAPSRG